MMDIALDMSVASNPPQLATATLSISGMTCSSCSNDIQHALESLAIVRSCNISSLTHSGTVLFDNTLSTSIQEITETIEDKGYECTVRSIEPVQDSEKDAPDNTDARTIQLVVEGVFCRLCPPRIVNSLVEHFGNDIQVDISQDSAELILSITYRPDTPCLTIRSIIAHIQTLHSSFLVRPYHPPSAEDASRIIQHREQKKILWRLVLAAIIAIPTLFIGVVWMSLVPEDNVIHQWFEQTISVGNVTRTQLALFLLATPIYFLSASTFHFKAGREIYSLWRKGSGTPVLQRFYRFGSMNLLISAGTSVAYFASIILLILSATSDKAINSSTYFDSVVFLTFFILIGKYLEALSKAKAGDAVSLLGQLKPEKASLVISTEETRKASDAETIESSQLSRTATYVEEMPADLLEFGDTVIVHRGSTPPADGTLLSDDGQFDESSLTGESSTVQKKSGDKVFLGTINTGNSIQMTVTNLGGSSMLDQIITVVREGQTKRAPIERIADSITAFFVPVITFLAILTFFVWLVLGQSGALDPKYINGHIGGWPFWSLEFAIAVFVVACPCGIGLAAPTALYVGSGLAAKAGILVRGGGEAFQDASDLDAVVFDKTGTLTEGGDLQVTDCEMLEHSAGIEETALWSIVRTLEENSSHPIAKALVTSANKHEQTSVKGSDISEIPGQGMKGTFTVQSSTGQQTFEAILGSEGLIHAHDPAILEKNTFTNQTLSSWKSNSRSISILAIRRLNADTDWSLATLFALSDPIRPSAAPTIAALQAKGIVTYMLSGDNPETARAVAIAVGIPIANVFASALPQDKAARIQQLKQDLARPRKQNWFSHNTQSVKEGRIAFVGDGINDAPALLASTVSISLSTGSPIAFTSSSFILLTPSLESIITLLSLSGKVFARIKWNFAWALVYNIILVPVAAGVLFRVREGGFVLGPVWASAAMALSSLSVVCASLAMRWGL